MKKIISMLIAMAVMVTVFAGCGKSAGKAKAGDSLKIGLIQLVEHPSLDEIREAFTTEAQTLAAEQGIAIEIDYKNAQGEISMISSICRVFVDDKVDVIVAIATPTAQGAAATTKDIPIVFSAVTDPIAAGLLEDLSAPAGNITGVSDHIDVERIFQLAQELTPEVKSYGLIYNKGEVNSVSVIEETKAYLDGVGLEYTEKVVNNTSEVQQASRMLLESCDAIFVPIDNTVAKAMTVLSAEAIKAGKPVYTAADSLVADGGLATAGINYTLLGKQTAEMTIAVLSGTPVKDLPVQVLEDIAVVVNTETAKAIGVDVSKYA